MADRPTEPQRPEPSKPEQSGLTAAEIRWIMGGVLAILFGVFIAQNADPVSVQFVFFSAKVRLIWVFGICAIIGAIIDRLLQRRGVLPSTRRRDRLKQEKQGRAQ
jgi:uncharacterized integral membrane protein